MTTHGPTPKTPTQPRPVAKFGPKLKPLADRFWAKVEKTQKCWLWKGLKNGKAGYGMIYDNATGKKELAHRVSWFLATGAYPTQPLLHKCDTPTCVNPDCLYDQVAQSLISQIVTRRSWAHVE